MTWKLFHTNLLLKKIQTMSIKYNVHVGEYAESHYIKDFSKKYKKEREYTFFTIVKMLEHLDNFL